MMKVVQDMIEKIMNEQIMVTNSMMKVLIVYILKVPGMEFIANIQVR